MIVEAMRESAESKITDNDYSISVLNNVKGQILENTNENPIVSETGETLTDVLELIVQRA